MRTFSVIDVDDDDLASVGNPSRLDRSPDTLPKLLARGREGGPGRGGLLLAATLKFPRRAARSESLCMLRCA